MFFSTLSGHIEMNISISILYKLELELQVAVHPYDSGFFPFLNSGWSGLE